MTFRGEADRTDELASFFGGRNRPTSGPRPGSGSKLPVRTGPASRGSARREPLRPAGRRAPRRAHDRAARLASAATVARQTKRPSSLVTVDDLSRRRMAVTPPLPVRSGRLGPVAALYRSRRRLTAFLVIVTLLASGVVVRLVDISRNGGTGCRTADVADCRTYGASQRTAYRPIPAGRGALMDRNGQPFALSVARPNVVADPHNIGDPLRTAAVLAPILGTDAGVLSTHFEDSSSRYEVLAPTVTPEVAAEVEAAIETHELQGIAFEDQYVRVRPSGDLAHSIVGRTHDQGRVDDQGREGRSGLELAYDRQLDGTDGRLSFEKDRDGGTIAGSRERIEAARAGTDLYLTLDQSLQYAAEQAVIDQVTETGAEQGMAIITKPSTGEILAMVSVADDGTGQIASTADDRPVSTVFEPGSVNKMITIAGAIEDDVVAPDTVLDVPDHLQVSDHDFSDHDPHPVQPWSVTDILVTSSNVGTIMVAQQLGEDRIDHYLRAFGFGSTSGSDLPGEVRGLLLDPEDWSGTSIGSIPIGQGISVSALQMLMAYNVVANDGVAVAPKLIDARDQGAGKVEADAPPRQRVLSAGTSRAMATMLTKVVADGTGKPAQVPGYPIAGKTGTARIPQPAPHQNPVDGYQDANGDYHYESSFVGFVPGADLSVIVTIQDAQTSIYGSEVAAPVFATLAALALRSESIPPPAVVDARSVPDLSASARGLGAEGPDFSGRVTQG